MEGSEVGILSMIKSMDPGFYFIIITLMILIVLTFMVSIYAAIRADKVWALMKRQHDIEEIKKEVTLDLQTRSGN